MRSRSWIALAALTTSGAGCGLILGLGDYKDGGTGGGSSSSSGAGGATASASSSSGSASSSAASSSGHGGAGGGGCVPGSTLPCLYNGPPGTEGKGLCHAGAQTCLKDGSGYTACNGEVDPNPAGEICGNGKDDDCNGKVDDGCMCTIGMDYPCYSGPGNTDMNPPCHDGTHTCIDGHSFGACTGEHTPVAEICGNMIDDNCDGQVDEAAAGCVCEPAQTQACWTGPAQAQHVGDCKDGTEQCAADGKGWQACMGEVLPMPEDCAVKGDEDCDGIPCSEPIWGNAWTGPSIEDLAWDAQSNIVASGSFGTSFNFGAGPLIPQGGSDVFVAKFDQAGNALWSFGLGDSSNQDASAIGVDPQGNIAVGGTFAGTMKVGVTTLQTSSPSDTNLFAMKLKPDGTPLWAVGFGDTNDQTLRDLAVDPATGDVIIVGDFSGSIAFGNGLPTLSSTGKHDAFIARLRAVDGAALWRVGVGFQTTPLSDQSAASVAIDPAGAVVVTGDYNKGAVGVTLGGTSYPTATTWIARFDAAGNLLQGKGFPMNNGFANGTAQARIFSNGDILMSGNTQTDPGFGAGKITSGCYAVRFTPALVEVWSQDLGGLVACYDRVAIDSADNIIFVDAETSSYSIGGHMIVGASLTKTTGAGTWLWTDPIGAGSLVAVSPNNRIALAGSSGFGPTNLDGLMVNAGTTYGFLATFYP